MQDGMSGDFSMFLKDGMTFASYVYGNERGALRIERGIGGAGLVLHGSPVEFRQVAEALHRLADEVERGVRRQRALDNAPRRRTTFVAEPAMKEEMEVAV
ncbi:hypothetical protein SAMN05216298_2449 [Glycomyces sambucus]|uniref:Uncharacterized protein n=1 Tax=Glycomyces sambucus TaxID=380244 RepID=A0A1G9GV81_9ACTN|nr:hypothetical protein [Glycomyces sambucus]SDL04620.1 hypothetical protein SAMN05216298_2449 [Glycomyces sambucus]